jgi:alpha-beta hydrolase superfamily lysophospholipase
MPASPIGAVLYLHGIQSHSQWFIASAQRLADAGFAVLLPDRRGSGRNDIERGHAGSARRLMRDAAEYLDELHVRCDFDRFHVVGVSWGGKWALAMQRQMPDRIASLTLVAPGLFSQVDLPLWSKIKVALCGLFNRRCLFDIPLNDPTLFTGDTHKQAFIRDDPLALRQVTSSFLLTSRKLDGYARNVGRRKVGPPMRVFLAGEDRIIDNHKTKQFIRHLDWPTREISEYSRAQHTLEFEPDPEPYFKELVDWLKEANRISGAVTQSCQFRPHS